MKVDIDKAIEDVSRANLTALGVLVDNKIEDGGQIAQKIDNKIDEAADKLSKLENVSEDVLAKLEEAKEELENKNFVVALQKIKESNELLNNKEEIDLKDDSGEATTTPEIENDGVVKGESTTTVWLIKESATSSCEESTCSLTPNIE